MVAYVKGTLAYVDGQCAVVDVGGVGYQVHVAPATASRLPGRGGEVQLFTYHQFAESGQALHGFLSREEVRLFTLLISVSGIGPKAASAILGTLSPQQLILAIAAEDAAAISRAPGVGRKTAQRVMLELRDKIKTADSLVDAGPGMAAQAPSSSKQDALDALLALGYGRAEAMQAVLETAEDDMAADAIIRLSLKKLMG